ncbi:MAG: prenyltransferase/squalene oxidase repeat-containing protein [Planctomycetota bacterium]
MGQRDFRLRVWARGPAGAALLCALACGMARAEDEEPAVPPDFVEITPKQEEVLGKAWAWLAKQQGADGSWNADGYMGTYRVAMTSLAGLALLAGGNCPGRGKYGANVVRAVEFVLRSQGNDGLFTSPNEGYQMYGHGFGMTFLAETYGTDVGMELNERIKRALALAVKKTQQSQSFRGGWYYSPNSGSDEGSVTVTQVQALRSVRNVGIEVPEKVIADAIGYVTQCQNRDGGIRYSVESGQMSSVALTAAGVEVFLMAGRYKAKQAERAIEYLKKNLDPERMVGGHWFYTNLYGSQAMFHIGGEPWARYFERVRNSLFASQRSDGSWQGDQVGSTYGTAIAALILAVPYRYLPVFQK